MHAPLSLAFTLSLLFAANGAGGQPESKPSSHAEHGKAERRITLTTLAEGAMLFDNLGTHHRPVTTKSKEAQAYFNQGLRLAYGFNHDEAARSFARGAQLDPSCAMCFWGAALVLGPNYNAPMFADRAGAAWDGVQRATALAKDASPVEQALIGALSKRYPGPEAVEPAAMKPFNEAYAAAMRQVAARFPDDADVQVLFAESLMDLNPWKLWSIDGDPAPGTDEIVRTLEAVLKRAPEHPGANHYYIHAVEPSPSPERALPSARRLAGLMPGAGHVVHMPAHIYQRVGMYAEASESNRRAVAADDAYMRKAKPWGYYPMYQAHNWGFLAFSASMEGRAGESLKAAREATRHLPLEMLEHMPGMDFFAAEPLLVMVRFGRYDALLSEPRPPTKYPVLTGLWLHAHGMALAARGRMEQARAEHGELVKLAAGVPEDMAADTSTARDVLGVAAKVLGAFIAEREKRPDALALWDEAVRAADRLPYAEPHVWFYPVRHFQGAALLDAKRWKDAEAVYREDLRRNPGNGWALFGLAQALKAQGRAADEQATRKQFQKAWARADTRLTRSAF
jgi:tetratricopeptide (TPR) repeat protein